MSSQEMESRFASLKQARDKGTITEAQFRNSVSQLRIQASDGFWYQIDPDSGSWLKWNGSTWEKPQVAARQQAQVPGRQAAQPRSTTPQPGPQSKTPAQTQTVSRQAAAQEEIPQKFFPLLAYIGKQTLKVFRQQFPTMVFFGVLGWLLHTYLLVFVNQGFGRGSWVGDLLATTGNGIAGTIIWMIGSGLLFSWIGQKLFAKGQKPPKQPPLSEVFLEAGELALAAMVAAAGISMILGIFATGWSNTAIAIGIGGTMLTAGSSVIGLLVSSAWSSTYGLKQSDKARKFSVATGKVAMVGGIAAFLLNTLPFMKAPINVIFGIAFLGLAFFLTHRENKSAGAMLLSILPYMAFMGVMAFLWNNNIRVLADDGGWQEAGGTFGSWIGSQGAAQAMISGIGPGIGTAIGPALFQVLISIGTNMQLPGGMIPPGTTPEPEIPPKNLMDENGNRLLVWDPEQYGPGANGQDGKPGWVWYNGNWVDPQTAKNQIDKLNPEANMPTGPQINMTDEDGNPIITWQPGKFGPDTKGNTGKPGMVWHWGEWVTPQQAQDEINQDRARQAQDQADAERNLREWQAKNAEQLARERAAGEKEIAEANARRAQEAAQAAYNKQLQEHILNKLQQDPSTRDFANELAADNNLEGLKDIYKEKLGEQMAQGERDAAHYNTMATIYGVGEVGAKVVVAGAKGALIAVGGPAGMLATGVAVGSISAAQEGTQSYVNGDSAGEILAHTAVGFATGVKDGAIGVYTQMPGIGTGAKYLIPAAADTAQTFIQLEYNDPGNVMGNLGRAAGSGALSIGSTYVGNLVDANASGLVKEGLNLATGAAGGAIGNVIQGGDPGEGALEGLIGAAGGRIGGHLGTNAADYARSQSEKPVQTAIGDANQARQQEIGLDGQSQKIKDLSTTIHEGDGGKTLVDEAGALDQLRDTQSSRTGKQAPEEIRDAIVNTRTEKLYKPADDTTIAKATKTLEENGMLQPGDKVVMDTFSTPVSKTGEAGSTPAKTTLGADRDARLAIERTDPVTGNKALVEVDRQHWENDAYEDFYNHTTKIAGGEQAITPDKYPNYFKRIDEMTHNNPEGLTPEQIQHRAWAEEHNQLFTDKNHVEASRDNSDQITKFVNGKEVQTQGTSNVVLVKEGQARLLDPEGYAKMWHEKSDVYARMGNQPEAIAQSQKGISEYMKIRQGYDKQGLTVAPIDNTTARAMEIITKAPVGVDATPQAMADVTKQLQSLGFKDTNDALGKVAMQNETLGLTTTKGLSSANTTRIGLNGIQPPEPGQPPEGTVY
jgi:hypothetical protein